VAALLAGIRHAAFHMRNHDAVAMLGCAQLPPHALRERRANMIDERPCGTALDKVSTPVSAGGHVTIF
jgi:hypothetical protein